MTWTGESLIKSNSQFFDRQDCNRSSISPHICRKASKSYAIYPWKSGSSSAVPWRTSFGLIRDSCQFSLLASQLYSAIYKPRKSTPCFSIYTHYLIISLLFLSTIISTLFVLLIPVLHWLSISIPSRSLFTAVKRLLDGVTRHSLIRHMGCLLISLCLLLRNSSELIS